MDKKYDNKKYNILIVTKNDGKTDKIQGEVVKSGQIFAAAPPLLLGAVSRKMNKIR